MNGFGRDTKTAVLARTALGAAVIATVMLLSGGSAKAAAGSGAAPAAVEEAGRVNVNSATAAELATLPGIGASKAAAIIAEREKKPFSSIDDLVRVRGIGPHTVEDLRSKVSIGR